jgi:antitoxin component YwqK of YwqJK toxin-antitoxin module
VILRETIRRILLEDLALQIQQLKDKYVGEGKPLKDEEFQKIQDLSHGKFYILAWLTKKIGTNLLKSEDLYKWKEYIDIFEKNKKKFKFQDLNLYKTLEDLQDFIETVIQIKEGDVKYEDIPQSSAFLSKNEIEKLTSTGGNKYLGFWKPEQGLKKGGLDGYQVFEISEPTKENWKIYRDLLGRCRGRDKGATIEICTIAHFYHFKDYLKSDKGSKYIVLFNLNDPLSPYQLHVESQQFMNKNDVERFNFEPKFFYKWLSDKSETYNYEKIASHLEIDVPVEGKGHQDEKGKQGVWKSFYRGGLEGIYTYVDNKRKGPFINFWGNGKVHERGTIKPTKGDFIYIDDYEKFFNEGDLEQKGKYDEKGNRIGIWKMNMHYNTWGVTYVLKNYDDAKAPATGLTKNDVIKVVAEGNEYNFRGKIIVFYPKGTPKALGQLTTLGRKTGNWTIFKPDGSIKLEGFFRNDKPTGNWTFFFTSKNGVEYLYSFDWDKKGKGKLYNKRGEFIKKIDYSSSKVPSVGDFFNF